ncbi:MAG: hypothetical protein FJ098_00240 [Deltaproteobacteria bacterium]|nr:hypothetical protein [Deltaproteobacteria bacterium]
MKETPIRFLVLLFLCAAPLPAGAQELPEPEEPLPADGPAAPADPAARDADPFSVYSRGQLQEIFIDEEFRLYDVRRYQGLVPGHPDRPEGTSGGDGTLERVVVERIGLEQMEIFSRVFAVVDAGVTPWVYDNFATADANPGTPYQIVMEIAGGRIPKRNDRRPLDVRAFATPILEIRGTEFKGGVRVVVTLKRKARYLPAQSGNTLYVDVER